MPPSARRSGRGRDVLITRDIDKLTHGMSSTFTLCQVAGGALIAIGLNMVGRGAWRQMHRWRRVKAKREAPDQRGAIGECVICMYCDCNSAFPCGHVVACYECALRCDRCPVCRHRGEPIQLFPAATDARRGLEALSPLCATRNPGSFL